MKKIFKRNRTGTISTILIILLVVLVVFIRLSLNNGNSVYSPRILIPTCIATGISILDLIVFFIDIFFSPDFKISIVERTNYLIFELAKNDRRIIRKNNLKIIKKMKKLILSDEDSIMEIPYNKKLFNFLMRVSK